MRQAFFPAETYIYVIHSFFRETHRDGYVQNMLKIEQVTCARRQSKREVINTFLI